MEKLIIDWSVDREGYGVLTYENEVLYYTIEPDNLLPMGDVKADIAFSVLYRMWTVRIPTYRTARRYLFKIYMLHGNSKKAAIHLGNPIVGFKLEPNGGLLERADYALTNWIVKKLGFKDAEDAFLNRAEIIFRRELYPRSWLKDIQ